MFTESGVLPSLDAYSKHQIVHGTLNINVPCPPPYKRKVWDYKSANSDNIRREINTTDWANLFQNRNVNEMAETFTDVFLNIISRNISNKIVTVDDKDAPWITHEVKTAIKRNSRVYKKRVKRGSKSHEHNHVREIQNLTNKLIRKAKTSYYEKIGNKLCDPKTGQKTYWTAFKKIVNKKKYTNIPPLIEQDHFISNFKQKAQIFNDYFADQCKIYDNGSVLPTLRKRTDKNLVNIDITE